MMKGYLWNSYKMKVLFMMLVLGLVFLSEGATLNVNATESTFAGIDNQTSKDLTWSITPEGKLTITGTGDYRRDAKDEYGYYYPSWYAYKDYILTAEVQVTEITSMERMFCNLPKLQTITFTNTDTSKVTTMHRAFAGCDLLQSLDLSGLDTRQVTNMSYMFSWCSSLQELVVKGTNFSTSNVTNMSNMFLYCEALQSLDVSGFDTSRATDMSSMFAGCEIIKTLDVSNFNTSNVTDMGGMFGRCSKMTTLTFGDNFTVEKVTDMTSMFIYCRALESLDLSTFKESAVTNTSCMFDTCASIKSISFPEEFDTSNVTEMTAMFRECYSLEELNISGFNTSKVKKMNEMFRDCRKLKELKLDNFVTDNVEGMHYMFEGCSSLTSLDLSNFNTAKVTAMSAMFNECSSLQSLNLSGFNTAKVEYMWSMFENCSKLQSIDVSKFDTSGAISMARMFDGCNAITELDLSSFDTSKYTEATEFVLKMNNLTKITTGKDKRAYRLVTKAENWMDDDGNLYLDDTAIEPEPNTTLYVCSGTFNIDYIYDGKLIDSQASYEMGTALPLSGYVTKEHYTFEGWYEDQQFTKKMTEISADRYGDITLYAKMSPETYAITYKNMEGVSNAEQLPASYIYGQKLELISPIKTCYLLEGWFSDEELTQKVTAIAPGTSGDILLYAKWTESHDLDKANGIVIKEATIVAEGEIQYKCKNCDYTETEKLPRIVTEESKITDEMIMNSGSDGDIKGSDFTKFQARADKTTKSTIRLKWNKVDGADGYKIYGNKCGKKNKCELLKIVKDGSKTTWKQKKLKKGTYYKFIIRAYKLVDGEEITLAVSKTIHAATDGGKKGNAKSVKIKTDKKMKKASSGYKLTLKTNTKYTIKATEVADEKKISRHRKIRFESTDKDIVEVSLLGKVTTKNPGTCYIYVYAQNGIYKKITVVVK